MSHGNETAPQLRWATLSREERDRAYNNTNAVANSADLIARRDRNAAAYRAGHPGHLDLAYGPGARTAFDLFPAADPRAPCLVFIHGGYWQRNAREDFSHYAEGLARAGWSVALPGYSLAPGAQLSGIVAEIGQALDWLQTTGADHGITGPVVLSGWSAGAQLAALWLDHPIVAAGLLISGVYDLEPLRDTYLDEALRLTDTEIATLSPLRLPCADKPVAITYGAEELPALVFDAQRLHDKRRMAGVPNTLIPLEGDDHFTILDAFAPEGAFVTIADDLIQAAARRRGRDSLLA